MLESSPISGKQAESTLIAPVWHTAVVVGVLLGFSTLGARSHSAFGVGGHGHIAGYLTAAAFEWLLMGFVWFGMRRQGHRLWDLIGERWPSSKRMFSDLGLAAIFLVGSNIILGVLGYFLKATPNHALRNLFPAGLLENLVFLLLALTAGICEELLCRGYLQRQLTMLTGSATAGIVTQGIIFGAAHGYQGWKYMLMISVYGCLFGAMAYWRRSLLPGMIAHFLQDGVLGLVVSHVLKRATLLTFLLR